MGGRDGVVVVVSWLSEGTWLGAVPWGEDCYSPRQEALELTWRRAALGRLIIGHSDCGFRRTAVVALRRDFVQFRS
jgi:hypothetical protein